MINDLGQVPSGEYVGSFVRMKTLGMEDQNNVYLKSRISGIERNEPVGPVPDGIARWECDIYNKNSVLETGDFRFDFGRPYSDGSIHSINAELVGEANHVKMAQTFWYKFNYTKVSFASDCKSTYFKIHFDQPQDNKHYHGTFEYNGVKYQLNGVRAGIRLGFEIDETNYNRHAGFGYVEWTPSSSRIDAIANGEAKTTDSIYFYFALPKVLANGGSGPLKENR